MEPAEMGNLVIETERAWQALGEISYGPSEAEKPSLKHRRSLYIIKDLKAGDVLSSENLRVIRPGLGLPPKYYSMIIGKKVKKDVKRGTPVDWDLLF
jgi:N-acetylneuraminate synthase